MNILHEIGAIEVNEKQLEVLKMLYADRIFWGDMDFPKLKEKGLWRTVLGMVKRGWLEWDKNDDNEGSIDVPSGDLMDAIDRHFGAKPEGQFRSNFGHLSLTNTESMIPIDDKVDDEEVSEEVAIAREQALNHMERINGDMKCIETYRSLYRNDDFHVMKATLEHKCGIETGYTLTIAVLDAAEYLCGLRYQRHIDAFTRIMAFYFTDNRTGTDFAIRKFLHPFMEHQKEVIRKGDLMLERSPF